MAADVSGLQFAPLRPAQPLDGERALRQLRPKPYAPGAGTVRLGNGKPYGGSCPGCGDPYSGDRPEYCPTPGCIRGQHDSRADVSPGHRLTPVAGADRGEMAALALQVGRWPFTEPQQRSPGAWPGGGGYVAPWLRDRGAEFR